MELECLRYEVAQPLAWIRLNRPAVLNAMNAQMWQELAEVLPNASGDDRVKVLIITGVGRSFSSGADLKESKNRGLSEYRDYLRQLQEVTRQLLHFDKPTIAAINGYALGSGYELALACDIRIAADEAQIGSPEAKVVSSVTGGALRLVQDLVGPGKAKELLFSGESIDGREAARIGLVNDVVPLTQLEQRAIDLATKIAANSSFSLRMIKRGLHLANSEMSLEAVMEYEIEACLACVSTRERQEYLERFAKRK